MDVQSMRNAESTGIQYPVPVKRHRGEPGHTRDTRDTRAHAGTRITRTNLTTIHPNPSGHKPARKPHGSHGRTSQPSTQTQRHKPARKPRPTQQPQEQPQARSRPLPAADSEEAAPGEPDPASTRSQSASPRLLEGGRRNEGARGRCVTAGGAARAPDELKTREAETGVSDGRGEADLRA